MLYSPFSDHLAKLQAQSQRRQFPDLKHQGKYIQRDNQTMLNMSSNDYLGLAGSPELQRQFLQKCGEDLPLFSSSSSRLLTGNFPIYADLEKLMAARFQRENCLLFNSGYHANIGILPAISHKKTLILADKLVHASMIDGIRLSQSSQQCAFLRFRHNDLSHLSSILEKQHSQFERIIIVTESIFSMDGDIADLPALVSLKKQYENVMLYVDEAHAVGVYGKLGLGLAEQQGCIQHIDFIVGTFGKALASMGAYVICDNLMKDYFINSIRPLIFSTALPPFNVAWTYFLFEQLPNWQSSRQHLAMLSHHLQKAIGEFPEQSIKSQSHIVPYILDDNHRTLEAVQGLQKQGFYCLPIRPPTVPQGTSRIRISLTADMQIDELNAFIECLIKDRNF